MRLREALDCFLVFLRLLLIKSWMYHVQTNLFGYPREVRSSGGNGIMTIHDRILLIPIIDILSSPHRWTNYIERHIAAIVKEFSPVVLPLHINVFYTRWAGNGRGKEHNWRGGGQFHDKGDRE